MIRNKSDFLFWAAFLIFFWGVFFYLERREAKFNQQGVEALAEVINCQNGRRTRVDYTYIVASIEYEGSNELGDKDCIDLPLQIMILYLPSSPSQSVIKGVTAMVRFRFMLVVLTALIMISIAVDSIVRLISPKKAGRKRKPKKRPKK